MIMNGDDGDDEDNGDVDDDNGGKNDDEFGIVCQRIVSTAPVDEKESLKHATWMSLVDGVKLSESGFSLVRMQILQLLVVRDALQQKLVKRIHSSTKTIHSSNVVVVVALAVVD